MLATPPRHLIPPPPTPSKPCITHTTACTAVNVQHLQQRTTAGQPGRGQRRDRGWHGRQCGQYGRYPPCPLPAPLPVHLHSGAQPLQGAWPASFSLRMCLCLPSGLRTCIPTGHGESGVDFGGFSVVQGHSTVSSMTCAVACVQVHTDPCDALKRPNCSRGVLCVLRLVCTAYTALMYCLCTAGAVRTERRFRGG